MKKIVTLLSLIITFSALQAQVDRSQPKPGPAPKINIGKPQQFQLPNGLTVLVVENHKLPRVSVSLTIDNAPFAEGSKAGLSDLTSSLMGNGTSKISKDKYNEEIEFYGATVFLHSEGGYASSVSKYFPRVLELMAQGAIDPLFTQEELEKERDKAIEGLKMGDKSASAIASRVRSVLAYGKNHPYGEYETEETIKNISLTDVKQHYANFFSPNNAYMVVIGDIKFSEVEKLVKKHWGTWKKGKSPKIEYTDPRDVQYTQINFVDVPNAVQSEIVLMNMNKLRMNDKDYFAVILANKILGGDFNSYLNMNLREDHGWTYGARSSISATRYISTFRASASVRNVVTDSSVVEFLKEIKRIRTEKVDPQALEDAKAGYIGNFVMQIEKPNTVASLALNSILHNLPDNFYDNYIANINAVTVDDIQRVANKYFSYDNSRIVIVGKGSEVIEPLEKLKIPIFYFDKYGKPIDKPTTKALDPSITPKIVLDNYIKAIGGMSTVSKIKTIATKGTATVEGMPIDVIIKQAEDKMLMDLIMGGQSFAKIIINGDKGYAISMGVKKTFEKEDIEEMKSVIPSIVYELALLKEIDKVTIKEKLEIINEKDAYALEFNDWIYYYDVETGLKLAVGNTQEVMGKKVTNISAYFDDYKSVKGVKFPYDLIQNMGEGEQNINIKVTEIKINEGVSDDDFK